MYRHGLLVKGVGICHGVAGSVYALLAVSHALDWSQNSGVANAMTDDNTEYLRKAVDLARLASSYEKLASSGTMKLPDRPWSLYEGASGMCCAWGAVLCRMEGRMSCGMPGFDDL